MTNTANLQCTFHFNFIQIIESSKKINIKIKSGEKFKDFNCANSHLYARLHVETNINPYPVMVIYLNFQPLEVVSRYRDRQPQVIAN